MSATSRYVSEYSRHPDPAVALGEALGGVVERIGTSPDLAIVFVSGSAARALPQIADAIQTLLCPTVLVGCTGQAIITGSGSDQRPGIQIWAGNPGPVRPVRLAAGSQSVKLEHGEVFIGLNASLPDTQEAGGNQIWLDDAGFENGQVGFCISRERVGVAHAHGFRPVGEPLAVTELHNAQVSRLGAEPADVTMNGVIAGLGTEERSLATSGLALGVVCDEYAEDFGFGDFSILPLKGTSPNGSLVVHDAARLQSMLRLGSIVQFHVPDPGVAVFDPRDLALKGGRFKGALILSIAGQVLPNISNFQDLGIGATAGLATDTDVLLAPDLSSPASKAPSVAQKRHSPAVVLFR